MQIDLVEKERKYKEGMKKRDGDGEKAWKGSGFGNDGLEGKNRTELNWKVYMKRDVDGWYR